MKSVTLLPRLVALAISLPVFLISCHTESLNPATDIAVRNSARGGIIHHISAGGADLSTGTNKPGYNANYSLVANVMSDGSVKGQYSDQFGHGDGGFHATVTCVFIDGNQAWISGIVTSGTLNGTDLTGSYVYTSVVDNGKEGDQIAYSYFSSSPVDCSTKPVTSVFEVLNGQVTVE